jgi:glycosyltransferase involved in cell wall biosynthesis
MSLGHVSKARAVWGVDWIRAVKELAWAARYLNWELRSLRSASCVVVPSPREVAFVSRYTRRPVLAVRNLASDLVDLTGVLPAAEAPLGVLFMGDMRFESNRHAARFLAREVWPKLRRRLGPDLRPQLVLGGWAAGTLVGDAVPAGDPDFVVMSDVPDVSELFSACRVVTVPIFFGGGSPHKVFEAAASGRPVICSRYVASTLEAAGESGFFVTDSADDYARHLASLLSDPELLCERQRQAGAWVREHYSLAAWNRDMNAVGHALGIAEELVA